MPIMSTHEDPQSDFLENYKDLLQNKPLYTKIRMPTQPQAGNTKRLTKPSFALDIYCHDCRQVTTHTVKESFVDPALNDSYIPHAPITVVFSCGHSPYNHKAF